jgi:hypothetical protein
MKETRQGTFDFMPTLAQAPGCTNQESQGRELEPSRSKWAGGELSRQILRVLGAWAEVDQPAANWEDAKSRSGDPPDAASVARPAFAAVPPAH